jgi:hypothetical protein
VVYYSVVGCSGVVVVGWKDEVRKNSATPSAARAQGCRCSRTTICSGREIDLMKLRDRRWWERQWRGIVLLLDSSLS